MEKAECVLEVIKSGAVENPFQGAHRRETISEPGSGEKMLEIVVALPFVATKARGRGGESLSLVIQQLLVAGLILSLGLC